MIYAKRLCLKNSLNSMQVDFQTDKLNSCNCGYKPDHYTVGYGSTPYSITCKCGKNLYHAKCKITGGINNLIDYWNKIISVTSINKLRLERDSFLEQKEEMIREEGHTPREYQYYWYENKGEVLHKQW